MFLRHQPSKYTFSSKTIFNEPQAPSHLLGPAAPGWGWVADVAPRANPVALPGPGPHSHKGERQKPSHESYFKSLCWTSSQALTRLSSMYIRKRMRSPQARLLVSCFRRLGLDLPLKPAERGRFGVNQGGRRRDGGTFRCVQPSHLLLTKQRCLRPGLGVLEGLPHPPPPRDSRSTEQVQGRPGCKAQPEGGNVYVYNFLPSLSSWGHDTQNSEAWECRSLQTWHLTAPCS